MKTVIQKIEFGNIIINGESFDSDITLFNDGYETKPKSHNITKKDFEDLLLKEPEAVIISTGFSNAVKVDEKIKAIAKNENIELFILPTKDAAKKFTELSGRKKVAAILHPTC